MILVAVGSNLSCPKFGAPRQNCEAALERLEKHGVGIVARSRWYKTSPVPRSDQPDFINGVVAVSTRLDPSALLAVLHDIETEMGRTRAAVNEARIIDLDLI